MYQVRVITVFTVFRLFWLSLCKIARSSIILLFPLINYIILFEIILIIYENINMQYFISCLSFWSKNATSILTKNILLLKEKKICCITTEYILNYWHLLFLIICLLYWSYLLYLCNCPLWYHDLINKYLNWIWFVVQLYKEQRNYNRTHVKTSNYIYMYNQKLIGQPDDVK